MHAISVTSPREPTVDYLGNALLDVFNPAVISDSHACLRRTVFIGQSLISGTAAYYAIPLSKGLPAWEVFATGSFVGFYLFDVWAIRNAVEGILGPTTESAAILFSHTNKGLCRRVMVLSGSATIAAISQVPAGIIEAKYNSPKYNQVLAFISTVLAGSFLPTLSIQVMIDAALRERTFSQLETTLDLVQQNMVGLVRQYRELFVRTPFQRKLLLIGRFNLLSASPKNGGRINQLVRDMVKARNQVPVKRSNRCERVMNGLATCNGVVLASVAQTVLGMYSFSNAMEVFEERVEYPKAVAGVWAGLVVSSSYLMSKAIVDTSRRLTTTFVNVVIRREEKTISEQLRPKTVFASKFLGLVIDLLAQGAGWVVWGDFYKEYDDNTKNFFRGTMCSAMFLLLFTASLDLVNELTEYCIRHKGNGQEKEIIQFYDQLQQIAKLVEGSSFRDFSIFLTKLPPETARVLLQKHTDTLGKLAGYIAHPEMLKQTKTEDSKVDTRLGIISTLQADDEA